MLQIIAFVFVLALVYAAKVATVLAKHEELSEQSSSFSWMSVRPEDAETSAAWATEEERSQVVAPSTGVIAPRALRTLRPATGVRA